MKRIFLLLILFSIQTFGQFENTKYEKVFNDETVRGSSVLLNGTTQYASVTPALRLTGDYALQDNFSDGDYTGWTVASGAYTVDNAVANPLSTNQYSLKCGTAGVISVPCNQAYGQWEFDWYKGADANAMEIDFMSTVASVVGTGYSYFPQADEALRLGRVGVSVLARSATGYFANNTWYHAKVTRNTNGQFYFYITGGAFTTETLVSISGGTGTNPVTDNNNIYSNYFALDLDANDRISNIVCQYGEGSLDLNSFLRILNTNNNLFEVTKGDWTDNGNHSVARNTTYFRTGVASLALTSTAAGDATTNFTSLPASTFVPLVAGEKYTYEMWARGTGILGSELYTTANAISQSATEANATTGLSVYQGTLTSSGIDGSVTPTNGSYMSKLVLSAETDNFSSGGSISFTAGKTYRVSFDIYPTAATSTFKIVRQGGVTDIIGTGITLTINSWNHITYDYLSTATSATANLLWQIKAGGVYTGTYYLDNVAIKEITLPSLTASLGGQTKTWTGISCVPATYTKLVWNFQATANEVGQPIKLYANQADVIYLDDASLTKAWDYMMNVYANIIDFGAGGTVIIGLGAPTSYPELMIRSSTDNNSVISDFRDGTYPIDGNSFAKSLSLNTWALYTLTVDRVGNCTLWLNGTSKGTSSTLSIGSVKWTTQSLIIGYGSAASRYISGAIGESSIFKFTDIATSNVNATTLYQAYKGGLPNTWTGGIKVFSPKWRGTTDGQFFYDYSGLGNNLSGTNVTRAGNQAYGNYPAK